MKEYISEHRIHRLYPSAQPKKTHLPHPQDLLPHPQDLSDFIPTV